MNAARPRIFGIGLNKTGTVSLHEALTLLGYRSLHWGGPAIRHLVRRAMAEGRPLLAYLDPAIDAFSDVEELTHHFDRADADYPGSRFILTVRDLSSWLDSRRRHVEKNRLRRAAGEYHGCFLDVDLEGWTAQYQHHVARVRAYFADRAEDLLEFDIAGGDGWGPLCSFLSRAEPDTAFPAANQFQPWPGGR